MVVFFSDLDNTLIFSHRHNIDEEKVVVELLNERHQSYMLQRVMNYIKNQKEIQLLPVTTRTVEQYSRIHILREQLSVNRALVCNGGILLENGAIDETWRNETYSICEAHNELSEIERLWGVVNKRCKGEKKIYVDRFMFYIATDKVNEMYQVLSECADCSRVSLGRDSRKVYVTAKTVNKGICAERYMNKKGINNVVFAGDSEFDIPMLSLGYPSIAANALRGKIKNLEVVYSENEMLATEIDKLIDKIINK